MTFGIAVALGRTPPPPPAVFNPSVTAVEIGYDLAGPPTVARILFDWRFDLIFGTAAIVFAGLYLAGVWRLRRRGDAWPTGRIVAWLCGCAVLLFATSSGHRPLHARDVQRAHGGAHAAVDAGAGAAGAGRTRDPGAAGAARRRARRSAGPARVAAGGAAQPGVAVADQPDRRARCIFVAGFYGLYFGGIFDAAVEQPRRARRDEPALPADAATCSTGW